jgi:hypothetical protein
MRIFEECKGTFEVLAFPYKINYSKLTGFNASALLICCAAILRSCGWCVLRSSVVADARFLQSGAT